ncbi:MAG: hypothetical protein ACYS0E_17975 [Planctomycetota bacterium]|jgi:hypothetical protein
MNTFMRYLWKEWRDHRVVVVGIALAVPLLLLMARYFVPQHFLDDPIFAQAGAWGALAITMLAFASDLVPGESRRGRLVFLARMPDGLPQAFRAKMFFLVGVLAAAPLYGLVAGACFGGWPTEGLDAAGGYVLLLLCAAPWIFAVSCWLPRGALALPATGLALALFALPFYLIHLWNPGYEPTAGDAVFWGVALGIGAFGVAWISFTRGFRYGGTFLSAGWRGLVASFVLLVPAYAYGGYRVHEWRTVDPASDEFRIVQVHVGEDDRYLFLNTAMELRGGEQRAHHALIVDVRDGSWRRVGLGFDVLEHITWRELKPARVVALYRPETTTEDETNPERQKMWVDWYDTRTGERFKSGWSNRRPEEVDQLAFSDREPWERGAARILRIGLGYLVYRNGPWQVADSVRRKVYALPKDKLRPHYPMVLPQGWQITRNGERVLYDPETGEEKPWDVPGVVLSVLRDGRLVIENDNKYAIFDPETREQLELEPPGRIYEIGLDQHFRTWADHGESIVRLDLETRRFETVVADVTAVALDEQRVLVLDDSRRIVRIDRATGERKVVFPR